MDNYYDVIICRYTLLPMRDFTASATALTAGGDNRKHARSGHICTHVGCYKQCDVFPILLPKPTSQQSERTGCNWSHVSSEENESDAFDVHV